MTNYEVLFIIDPALEDEKKEATVEAVKEIISAEGEVGNVDVWGMRKLAYPIQKKSEGYYVVIEFKAEPTLPKELDRRLKISDNVMRHLTPDRRPKPLPPRTPRPNSGPSAKPSRTPETAIIRPRLMRRRTFTFSKKTANTCASSPS